ncbi:restriction endonuclease subunit S [Otariodibacter sp.]|uniref:restriction endonuclease subunit S n=1 Tax=Otariodibacter sp. TaxID=3030919 RepID=UPI00260EC556|nr:restriction endonuclease subunit S [Otariodibacter sp.]
MASIQMGYSFRSRLESSEKGTITVIQMKDLGEDNIVDCNDLLQVDMDTIKENHFVKRGDLIFRSRSNNNTSAILLADLDKAVIAAPLFIIRVTKEDKILPEYLNWYIGQRDAQIFLASRSEGTVQTMISKQALEDLPIALPSLEKQKHIVELADLSAREQILLSALAERRKCYISGLLTQVVKGISNF